MLTRLFFVLVPFLFTSCNGQSRPLATPQKTESKTVGGGCDGCELIYTGMPQIINSTDTCVDWNEGGRKLFISGTVYTLNGRKPAPGVIVYYYHTDQTGHYTKRNDKPENKTVHGYLRGWVKTGADGRYSIYTTRPAPYPGNTIPAHIHLIIKEPELNEYYIDELVFDDDALLTTAKRKRLENRGGSGILKVMTNNNLLTASHDIILGLNIPGYPKTKERYKALLN